MVWYSHKGGWEYCRVGHPYGNNVCCKEGPGTNERVCPIIAMSHRGTISLRITRYGSFLFLTAIIQPVSDGNWVWKSWEVEILELWKVFVFHPFCVKTTFERNWVDYEQKNNSTIDSLPYPKFLIIKESDCTSKYTARYLNRNSPKVVLEVLCPLLETESASSHCPLSFLAVVPQEPAPTRIHL